MKNKNFVVKKSSESVNVTDINGIDLITGNFFGSNDCGSGKLFRNVCSFDDWSKIYKAPFNILWLKPNAACIDTVEFSIKSPLWGEFIKERIVFLAANVSFDSSGTQNFGYDEEHRDEREYCSIKKNGWNEVLIEIIPPGIEGFKAWIKDESICTIGPDGGEFIFTSGKTYLTLNGVGEGETKLIVSGPDNSFTKELTICVFEEHIFDLNFYTATDPVSTGTNVEDPIDTSYFRSFASGVLKQAVVTPDIITYNQLSVAYDLNENGHLDFYRTEDDSFNPEVDLIYSRIAYNGIVQVKSFNMNWLIESIDPNDRTFLAMNSVEGMKKGTYYAKDKDSNVHTVNVESVYTVDNTIVLQNELNENVLTDTWISKIPTVKGVALREDNSRYVAFIKERTSLHRMTVTALHETLHLPEYGYLHDVIAPDNIMHHRGSRNKNRLRYRHLQSVYSEPELQWSKINKLREVTEY